MTSKCPANPSTGVTAGSHRYTPSGGPPYTASGACEWWVCDHCGKRIRFDDRYPIAPRARRG